MTMNQPFYFTQFTAAARYDCNAYGAGGYNNEQTCSSNDGGSSTGTDASSGTDLAATGTNIAIGVGGGLALMITGAIILLKLRRKKS